MERIAIDSGAAKKTKSASAWCEPDANTARWNTANASSATTMARPTSKADCGVRNSQTTNTFQSTCGTRHYENKSNRKICTRPGRSERTREASETLRREVPCVLKSGRAILLG